MVQVYTLFLCDLSGCWIYQLAAGDPVSKPTTATEFVTTPSAGNMRAAFEHILEICLVVIWGTGQQRRRVSWRL